MRFIRKCILRMIHILHKFYKIRYWLTKLRYFIMEISRFKYIKAKKILEYPYVIQLPITYKCNFDCVMCGMRNLLTRDDFTPMELRKTLQDKLFKEVNTVGVNGGEPFIKQNINEYFKVIIDNLPNLSTFSIITNGYFTDNILRSLQELKEICGVMNKKINLAVSMDGIGDMQDFHRGTKNAYYNACNTIKKILERKDTYCDNLEIICTITRYNIYRINEIVVFGEKFGINISYNIAAPNVRIDNYSRIKNFHLFQDEEARLLAIEFFYGLYVSTNSEKYFGLYLFLKYKRRFSICPCQINHWITLTPNNNIGFCASNSKELGSCATNSAFQLVQNNLNYLKDMVKSDCQFCSTYMGELNTEGLRLMHRDLLKREFVR